MQRVPSVEEGKDPSNPPRAGHVRVLPWRLLLLLVLFLGACLLISIISMYSIRRFGVTNFALVRPSFESCFIEPNSLDQWIKPPSNLLHSMNDEELFWRATFSPQIRRFPFARTQKIAFMFLTKGPLPLAPLWERFFKGNEGRYSIYIHSLPSYQEEFPSSSVFYKRHVPSQVAEWGRMSMCDAEKRLVANALLDISNEWFILLSESCIPFYNFSSIYHYISKSKYSYVGAFDDPGPFGRGRYNHNMAPEVNLSDWRKGSQWFEIDRKLAVNIVGDTTYYRKFEAFCKPACYVDEHYFPTMLNIQSPNLLANRSITWVDWSRGGPHPATFGRSDINPEFFKRVLENQKCSYNDKPSTVCFLFGRKFSPSTLGPLIELSSAFLHF
ncbi:hypothetical protein V2J09_019626 [Rumex salicifolius]